MFGLGEVVSKSFTGLFQKPRASSWSGCHFTSFFVAPQDGERRVGISRVDRPSFAVGTAAAGCVMASLPRSVGQ